MTTITLPRATVEQALEALEYAQQDRECPSTTRQAITALRAALAQEQPNPPGCDHCNHPLYAATKCRVCGRVTEQAEPVEPVAWMCPEDPERETAFNWKAGHCENCGKQRIPLYTAPTPRKPLTEEAARAKAAAWAAEEAAWAARYSDAGGQDMMTLIRRMITGPSAEELAARELAQARRALLEAQTGEEYARSQVIYNQARIARLRAYLANQADDNPSFG